MPILAVFLWISNIALDTAGHLAFKYAAVAESEVGLARWKKMMASAPFWIGICCFCLEFCIWFGFLSLVPLSLAMLVGSINIVVVMLAGRLLFRERLEPLRLAGMGLIAVGVTLAGGFV